MNSKVQTYWEQFKSCSGRTDTAPYDVFKIGDSVESADAGLALIIQGEKTTTSSLPEEFQDIEIPYPGALSVVLDGRNCPGAVVETTHVERKEFSKVDEAFAYAYGEWDRTLSTWQTQNRKYYQHVCQGLGIEWHDKRELICETFKLIFEGPSKQQESFSNG